MTDRRDLAAVTLLALTALIIGLRATGIAYDDAWITYRYAYNLATGEGFVYNHGERFLGTSAPGYAVLLAAAGAASPASIPAVSAALCVLALAAAGLGLFAYGRASNHRLGGFLAGAFFIVNPVTVEAFGGEMLPQAALVIWAITAQVAGRPTSGILLACAAAAIRPDGLLAVALVGLHQTWKTRTIPWKQVAVAGAVLGVWFAALWLYFGTPLPQTLGAKNAQRLTGIWRELGTDMVAWLVALTTFGPTSFGSRPAPGFTGLLALAVLGGPALLWMRHWWTLLAWPVLYMLAYRELHVPFYHWYTVPPLVAIVVAAAAAVEAGSAVLVRLIARAAGSGAPRAPTGNAVPAAAVAAALVFVAVPLGRFTLELTRGYPNPVERAYADIGKWLSRETPPSASVGYLEIGIVGYHARRTIIDPLGLVNPGVAPHVAGRDFLYAYRTHRPDVIVHNPAFFPEYLGIVLDEPWFKSEYEPVTTLDSGRAEPVTIYRRTRGGTQSSR